MSLADRFGAWWSGLSGGQRFLLGVGVPVAGGAAVVANLRDRPEPEPGPTDGTGQGLGFAPGTPDQVAGLGLVRSEIAQDVQTQLDAVQDTLGTNFTEALAALEAEREAEAATRTAEREADLEAAEARRRQAEAEAAAREAESRVEREALQAEIDAARRQAEAAEAAAREAARKASQPAPAPAPAPAPKPAPAPAPEPTPTRTYTVVRGDTLWKISARFGLDHWRPIYDANRSVIGSNPDLIKPGQTLTIPQG